MIPETPFAMKIIRMLLLPACLVWTIVAASQSKTVADLIITHANVWTVDEAHPKAQAVAVFGDRIIAVGSNAEVEALRGPNTRVIDAGGKLLLPGFNDAHVHFVSGGLQLDSVQLNDVTGKEEFVRRVAERAKKTPKGEWIQGGDWDETKWPGSVLPTKEWIDSVTPDNPVFLSRYDGHSSLANSAALKLAGVNAQTSDPPGGVIVRDAQGNPTGDLKDAATDLVYKVIPPPSHDQVMRAVRRALEHAASVGVTSVQNMDPDYADIAAYAELLQSRRTHDSDLRRAVNHAGGRSGKDWNSPRLWRALSEDRRRQRVRGRVAGIPHCLFFRAVPGPARQSRPAVR